MFCRNCGKEIGEEDRFCRWCGSSSSAGPGLSRTPEESSPSGEREGPVAEPPRDLVWNVHDFSSRRRPETPEEDGTFHWDSGAREESAHPVRQEEWKSSAYPDHQKTQAPEEVFSRPEAPSRGMGPAYRDRPEASAAIWKPDAPARTEEEPVRRAVESAPARPHPHPDSGGEERIIDAFYRENKANEAIQKQLDAQIEKINNADFFGGSAAGAGGTPPETPGSGTFSEFGEQQDRERSLEKFRVAGRPDIPEAADRPAPSAPLSPRERAEEELFAPASRRQSSAGLPREEENRPDRKAAGSFFGTQMEQEAATESDPPKIRRGPEFRTDSGEPRGTAEAFPELLPEEEPEGEGLIESGLPAVIRREETAEEPERKQDPLPEEPRLSGLREEAETEKEKEKELFSEDDDDDESPFDFFEPLGVTKPAPPKKEEAVKTGAESVPAFSAPAQPYASEYRKEEPVPPAGAAGAAGPAETAGVSEHFSGPGPAQDFPNAGILGIDESNRPDQVGEMARARAEFFMEETSVTGESPKKKKKADVRAERKAAAPEKKMSLPKKLLLIILIFFILLEGAYLAGTYFLPDNPIVQMANEKVAGVTQKVLQLISKDEEKPPETPDGPEQDQEPGAGDTGPGDTEARAPDLPEGEGPGAAGSAPDPAAPDGSGTVPAAGAISAAGFSENKNIAEIVENADLKYAAGQNYKMADIRNSAATTDDPRPVMAAVVAYNSQWVDYVNTGNTAVLETTMPGSPARDSTRSFSQVKKIKETFLRLELGEVRKGKEGYYIWVREEIQVESAGKTGTKTYRWIYQVAPYGEGLRVVNYYAYS